jgi:hypothetical protein
MLEKHIIFILLTLLLIGHPVSAGTKGDETDLIIRTIMANYKKEAHPNSIRGDGAVVVEIVISPLALNIVGVSMLSSIITALQILFLCTG